MGGKSLHHIVHCKLVFYPRGCHDKDQVRYTGVDENIHLSVLGRPRYYYKWVSVCFGGWH